MSNERLEQSGRVILLAALLAAVTILAYQPAWHAGFIWDDDVYVINNKLLTAPDGLKRIWFSLDSPSQYFPLVYTALRWERHLWGLAPEGYHWVNILLHTANALLLWRVLRRMAIPGAWLGAALFALHPVQVESVAWVTELKNVLSLFFCLLAVRSWLEFIEDRDSSWRFYAAALIFQCFALFAKTTACTLPAALLLIVWLKGKPIYPRRLVQVIPFLVAGVAMGMVSIWFERYHQNAVGESFAIGPLARVLIAGRGVWFYLGKLIWPLNLSFSYSHWEIDPRNVLAYGWLLAVFVAAFALRFVRPIAGRGPETAAIYYVAMLSPLLGLIMEYTFRYSFVADHYQYAACIGPLTLAAVGIEKFVQRFDGSFPAMRPVTFAVILGILATLTWRQCGIYENAESLWRATLERTPSSLIARNNLSQVLLGKGDFTEAIHLSQEVLALNANDATAENNLGYALLQTGRLDDSIAHCRKSIALQPNAPDAYYNIGQAFMKKSQFDAAITNFQMAVQLKPEFSPALCNLGYAQLQSGQVDAAIASYEKSIAADPEYSLPRNDLGSIELRLGKTNEALAQFQKAVGLSPEFIEARYNLANVLMARGRLDDARSQYEKVTELRPNLPQAHYALAKLAAAYAQAGNMSDALATAEHALQLARAANESPLVTNLEAQIQAYRSAASQKKPSAP
ncbi:MAG TPA: tetratricopeptide repeat protein [Verrucomicrobiae bacterium]